MLLFLFFKLLLPNESTGKNRKKWEIMKLSKNKKNKIVRLSKIKFKDWYILVQQKIALDAIERRYPEKKEREREGKKTR